MKSTDTFKKTIQSYLENRAKADALFAVTFAKEGKNMDDCITYILNTVQASGCSGFADEEIFSMAVHHYDEENIKIGAVASSRVVVNHEVVLTEEEKTEARKEAVNKFQAECLSAMKSKSKPNLIPKKESADVQASLFD